jgi:lipocalin
MTGPEFVCDESERQMMLAMGSREIKSASVDDVLKIKQTSDMSWSLTQIEDSLTYTLEKYNSEGPDDIIAIPDQNENWVLSRSKLSVTRL